MPKKKATKKRASKVPLTRACGQWSEARFWSFVRSNMRRMSTKWPPKYAALKAVRRKSQSTNKRLLWEFQCVHCQGWFPAKAVDVDHIVPCGSLRSFDDLPGFAERMLCEADGFRVLCKECHNKVTHQKDQEA